MPAPRPVPGQDVRQLNIARVHFSSPRAFYVTHLDIERLLGGRGVMQVNNHEWLKIAAETFALAIETQSNESIWFGQPAYEWTSSERVDYVEFNILQGFLKVFVDISDLGQNTASNTRNV